MSSRDQQLPQLGARRGGQHQRLGAQPLARSGWSRPTPTSAARRVSSTSSQSSSVSFSRASTVSRPRPSEDCERASRERSRTSRPADGGGVSKTEPRLRLGRRQLDRLRRPPPGGRGRPALTVGRGGRRSGPRAVGGRVSVVPAAASSSSRAVRRPRPTSRLTPAISATTRIAIAMSTNSMPGVSQPRTRDGPCARQGGHAVPDRTAGPPLLLGPLLRHVDPVSATVWVETDRPATSTCSAAGRGRSASAATTTRWSWSRTSSRAADALRGAPGRRRGSGRRRSRRSRPAGSGRRAARGRSGIAFGSCRTRPPPRPTPATASRRTRWTATPSAVAAHARGRVARRAGAARRPGLRRRADAADDGRGCRCAGARTPAAGRPGGGLRGVHPALRGVVERSRRSAGCCRPSRRR